VGLRFRRSFRAVPGWRVNFSKSGISTSFGRRGAWFTVGKRGTRETIGIPGTGISYTTTQGSGRERSKGDDDPGQHGAQGFINLVIGIAFIAALLGVAYLIGRLTFG
jgi:hypothetical protein